MKFKKLGAYRVGGTASKMQLEIPVPKTPTGRTYRYSPNPDAHPRHFVMGGVQTEFTVTEELRARMKLTPRSPQTVCPYSGHVDADKAFVHPDDRDAVIETVKHAAAEDVRAMVAGMFKDLERKNRGNKFVTIKAKSTRNHRPKPRFTRSDLLRELVCDHCGRDYGVYAIALYCPDCGAPNVRLHFQRECVLVGAQVDLAEAQHQVLAELAYRLLGNAHEDVLTAFEATLKTTYHHGRAIRQLGDPARPVGNDFQNVERGRKRYADLQIDPYAVLSPDELAVLLLNIQKRHVIGHNLGVVDAKFAEHADQAKVGETVRLVAADIKAFAAICQKVIDELDGWLVGAPSPNCGDTPMSILMDGQEYAAPPARPSLEALDVKLSSLARQIGLLLANASTTGIAAMTRIGGDTIKKAFPAQSPRELNKAIAELENEGFVTIAPFTAEISQPFATADLFAMFDPVAIGSGPYADACQIVEALLADARNGDSRSLNVASQALREKLGWELRRFNPALALVIGEIDDNHVSRTIDGEYVVRSFFITPSDELALEQLLSRLRL